LKSHVCPYPYLPLSAAVMCRSHLRSHSCRLCPAPATSAATSRQLGSADWCCGEVEERERAALSLLWMRHGAVYATATNNGMTSTHVGSPGGRSHAIRFVIGAAVFTAMRGGACAGKPHRGKANAPVGEVVAQCRLRG
jgi:hypothetical protein